jgi:hypothetical protein
VAYLGVWERSDVDVFENGPQEADHLTGDRGGCDLFRLLGGEPVKDLVEAVLASPGVGEDRGILAFLPAPERRTHGRSAAVAPRGLNEHMTYAGVAGFGDRSKPTSVAGGVLTGHETEVGHELAWTLEAAQIVTGR